TEDSTPRHGRLLHPPGRNEMIAITPQIIFSKEVAPKQATPLPRQDPSLPEIVSDQISGDGAWMNFRFSRVLPPGVHPPPPSRLAPPPHARAGSRPLSITMPSQPPRIQLCKKSVLVIHLALGRSILSR